MSSRRVIAEGTSSSPEETAELAALLGAFLPAQSLILLCGELGAGKTVFVRGLATGLGLDPLEVTSPTYVLQHIYKGGKLTLYHIDAYRLSGGAEEFSSSGLQEGLSDPNGIMCLEWPQRIETLPEAKYRFVVELEHYSAHERSVSLSTDSDLPTDCDLSQLKTCLSKTG